MPDRLLTPWSPEFSVCAAAQDQTNIGSTSWFSANAVVAYPFRLWKPGIVKKLGWVNGSSAGGQCDVGIYSAAWARLISTGDQTGSGNSSWQWIDVTDTPLAAGKYYLACARDNITANRVWRCGNVGGVPYLTIAGVHDSTSDNSPLPDPLSVSPAATCSVIYLLGIKMQPVTW